MRTNNCKKALSLALILMLALMSLTGCGSGEGDDKGVQEEENTLTEVIYIAALNGPTGMGTVSYTHLESEYGRIYRRSGRAVGFRGGSGKSVPVFPSRLLYCRQ